MDNDFSLQLEWAWKPMAAMMCEKKTDLVYWIPPLYRNNIKTAAGRVARRKSMANRSSLNRAPSTRLPYTHLQAAHQASQRKKKLGRRRAKLAVEVSFEDPTDTESIVQPRRRSRVAREISLEDPTETESIGRVRRRSRLGQRVSFENATDTDSAVLTSRSSRSDSRSEWADSKDEDIESGIHDATDYNADDMSLHNVKSIQEEEDRHTGATMKRRLGEHRRAHRNSIKPKVPPKPDFITKSFEAIDKPKPAPTLIRLLEKVSHIHCPPINIKPIKPELRKFHRRGSESKSSLKGKVRRPSVKIYGNAPQRLSNRRAKSGFDDPNDHENQCVIVSVDNEHLITPPQVSPKAPPKASPKAPPKSSPKAPLKSTKAPKSLPKSPKLPTKTATKSSIKQSSIKSSSKDSTKSTSKSTPKCLSKASLKSLPKEFQKEIPKDMPKTPEKRPFGILKDPPPFGILKDNPVKPEEAEYRNAQLQMILRLLAQLYEEKVSRQDTEIQNMKARIHTQDKLMKQMAHVVLELKEDVTRIKIQSTGGRLDIPANILNIKVGDN